MSKLVKIKVVFVPRKSYFYKNNKTQNLLCLSHQKEDVKKIKEDSKGLLL